MWYPDDGQAQYEAEMNAAADYDREMEANASYAEHEAEMHKEEQIIISELEAEIQMHENEISKLQKRIEKLSV